MARLDRLQSILNKLQSQRITTAKEIAQQFAVSLRTVYRDIRSLEQAGIPIGSEAGVGYFLAEGYHLPPVMFSQKEARALLLGGLLIEHLVDAKIKEDFKTALDKILTIIPETDREELSDLKHQTVINPWEEQQITQLPNDFLAIIHDNLPLRRTLRLRYISGSKQTMSIREIEPLGVSFYGNQWHVIGWCRLRKDYRDFRIDRIQELHVLNESYNLAKHPPLKDYLQSQKDQIELTRVVLRFNKNIVHYIEKAKFAFGYFSHHEHNDYVEMEFATFGLDSIARWVLMSGNSVKIIEPPRLKVKVTELFKELNLIYG